MSHESTLKKRDWTSYGANRENEAYKMFIISLISSGKSKAWFKRRTLHVPNLIIRFGIAHVKFDV